MSTIDLNIPKDMFGSMFSSLVEESPPVSLNLTIPFLDETFIDVKTDYRGLILESAFSILMSIVTRYDEDVSINEENDDYEDLEAEGLISGIVDTEIIKGEYNQQDYNLRLQFYEDVLDATIKKLDQYLYTEPMGNIENELTVLSKRFLKDNVIRILHFKYYPDVHLLWMVIK